MPNVDDRLLNHGAGHGAAAQKGAFDIHVLNAIPFGLVEFDHGHAVKSGQRCGIVDQNIDLPKMCQSLLHHRLDLPNVRHIGHNRQRR